MTSVLKWLFMLVLSIGAGNFVMNIMENTQLNVWLARATGAVVAAIVAIICHYLFIKDEG